MSERVRAAAPRRRLRAIRPWGRRRICIASRFGGPPPIARRSSTRRPIALAVDCGTPLPAAGHSARLSRSYSPPCGAARGRRAQSAARSRRCLRILPRRSRPRPSIGQPHPSTSRPRRKGPPCEPQVRSALASGLAGKAARSSAPPLPAFLGGWRIRVRPRIDLGRRALDFPPRVSTSCLGKVEVQLMAGIAARLRLRLGKDAPGRVRARLRRRGPGLRQGVQRRFERDPPLARSRAGALRRWSSAATFGPVSPCGRRDRPRSRRGLLRRRSRRGVRHARLRRTLHHGHRGRRPGTAAGERPVFNAACSPAVCRQSHAAGSKPK